MSGTNYDMRQQVANQYEVVAHLASAIARVHRQIEPVIRGGSMDHLLPMIGERSARLMDQLGDILNGMDAVTATDLWTDPVFEKAHAVFAKAEGRS